MPGRRRRFDTRRRFCGCRLATWGQFAGLDLFADASYADLPRELRHAVPTGGVQPQATSSPAANRLALGALPDPQRGAREQRRLGPALHAGCAADPGRRNPHGIRPRPKGRSRLGEALPKRVRLAWPAALCFGSRLPPIVSRASSYVRRGKPSFTLHSAYSLLQIPEDGGMHPGRRSVRRSRFRNRIALRQAAGGAT